MADYWKSQDRKYCDFCKCWIADNKPSRDFHENGRRHKENVKKRLKSISKDSSRALKESEKVDAAIKAMEAAAMEAYKKDVENNADWTSVAINKKMQEENLEIASGSSKKVWREVASKGGKNYFWNTVTNETSWEAPPEGHLTLQEQQKEKDKETSHQLQDIEVYNKNEALLRLQEEKHGQEEERARLAREKLKERRVKQDTPPPVYGPIIDPGKNDPYGKWQKIETSAPVDLQLPQQEYLDCPVVVEPEPVVKEFKEKTFNSLGDSDNESLGECSSFKKRKILSGAKRNTRKRLDDD